MTENETNMSIKYAVCVLESIGNGLTLSNENDREEACVLAIQAIDKVQQFEAIGTIEEFKALKEKSAAKKPYIQQSERGDCFECPNCDSFIGYVVDCQDEHYQDNYCPHCGQKLDWQ